MLRRSALLALVIALGTAAPAVAVPDDRPAADPFTQLGGGSPSCREDVGPAAKTNCAATGSVVQRHPISSYELDVHVPFSITSLGNAFLGALQSVGGLIWMGFVYLIKGVLLLLEWGFSIDLLGSAMSGVRRTLTTLHDDVIGQPWFLASLSVTALWAIWRGLVQRQATSTITGLLATVGLMLCALVILARPGDTVGYASRLANDASLSVLSAATAQPLDRPARSMAQAAQNIFDSMVRDPWCALEFGSVKYCDEAAPWPGATATVAESWLAEEPGSDARDLLYHTLKGDLPSAFTEKNGIKKQPERVRMQEAGGTFSRFAILGLIAIGMLGAAALLAYLGIRLLLASVMVLLLLLFAPAMLLAPAFGEGGRATFLAWGKRLVGALAAKLVFALFLAVVLAAATMLRRIDVGWFGTWLLQIAFWWGVLIKRHELIGFVSVRSQEQGQRGGFVASLAHGYYALQMGRSVKAVTGRVMHQPVRAAQAITDRTRAIKTGRNVSEKQQAIAEFETESRRVLEHEHERARAAAGERQQLQRELRVVDRRLTAFDEDHAAARASGRPVPLPSAEQAALLRRRRSLLEGLASPELREADQVVLHGERNKAQAGDAVTARDLANYRRQRADDMARELPVDHERNLRAAGVDPTELANADDPRRAELLDQVKLYLGRERALLKRIGEDDLQPVRELRVDPDAVRARREKRFERTGAPR